MINFDDVTKGNIEKHNSNWPEVYDLYIEHYQLESLD